MPRKSELQDDNDNNQDDDNVKPRGKEKEEEEPTGAEWRCMAMDHAPTVKESDQAFVKEKEYYQYEDEAAHLSTKPPAAATKAKPDGPEMMSMAMAMEQQPYRLRIPDPPLSPKDDPKPPEPEPKPEPEPMDLEFFTGWIRPNENSRRVFFVKRIPMYCYLPKHHAIFSPNELKRVLEKIQDFFRAESLQVQYCNGSATSDDDENDDTTVSARCTSIDGVEFVVSFWETELGEYAAQVQRTAGSSELFAVHQYRDRILDLILEKETSSSNESAAPHDPLVAATELSTQMESLLRQLGGPTAAHGRDCMEIVRKLLKVRRYDAVQGALETLLSMTDVSKTGSVQAASLSHDALRDEVIAPMVVELAIHGRFPAGLDYYEESIAKYHTLTALTVLAQAVTIISDLDLLAEINDKHNCVEALLAAVKQAQSAPHVAYLCTHILVKLCEIPKCRVRIERDMNAFRNADRIGRCSHAALAAASSRLLRALNAV